MARRRVIVAAAALLIAAFVGLWVSQDRGRHEAAAVVSIETAAAYQNPELISRAWSLPVASLYRADFEFQDNPSFCGPTSAANVARSVGRPTDQRSVLRGTSFKTFFGFAWSPGNGPGMTLDQLAEVLHIATDRPTTVIRGPGIDAFREELRRSNDPRLRYVVNFDRAPLWGAGHGHISPVLGYLEAEDLAFIGDVNRRYAPFLVSPERLLEAMNTTDTSTGELRGLVRLEPPDE